MITDAGATDAGVEVVTEFALVGAGELRPRKVASCAALMICTAVRTIAS